MNETVSTTPSLLTLTAPTGRGQQEAAPAEGFAEELSAAASEPRRERQDTDSSPESAESSTRETAESPKEQTPTSEPAEEHTEDDQSTDSAELGLLSVTVATETLVVETSPDAVLPEEAATTIDVGLESNETLTPLLDEATENAEPILPNDPATGTAVPVESLVAEASASVATDAALPTTPSQVNETAEPVPTVEVSPLVDDSADGEEGESGESPQQDNAASEESSLLKQPASETVETIGTDPEALTTSAEARPASTTDQKTGDEEAAKPQSTPPVEPIAPVASTELDPSAEPANETTSREPAIAATSGTSELGNERPLASRIEASQPRVTVDASRFVSRVAGAINSANERGGAIEIRLSPPELGALRVSLEVKEGVLTAQLEAETPAARTALLDNLPALRDRLEQQQIRIEKFDVDVRDESNQRGGDWQPSDNRDEPTDRRPNDQNGRPAARQAETPAREATEQPTQTGAPGTIVFEDKGINLVA